MIDGPIPEGLTFDDVLLLPGKSTVLPTEVDTRTCFTRKLAFMPLDLTNPIWVDPNTHQTFVQSWCLARMILNGAGEVAYLNRGFLDMQTGAGVRQAHQPFELITTGGGIGGTAASGGGGGRTELSSFMRSSTTARPGSITVQPL